MDREIQDLAAELVKMAAEDARVRERLAHDGTLYEGYNPEMRAVHDRNAARLAEILDSRGWPMRSLVGEHAARAAWLILQHAISHPGLQRRGLALLKEAPAGEVAPVEIAMLEDRIRTYEGRGQLYGTQFDWDEKGEMSPLNIEDPDDVDERRAAINLPPLEEEIKRRRAAISRTRERPPADWAGRKRKMEMWFRAVGWRKDGEGENRKAKGGRKGG